MKRYFLEKNGDCNMNSKSENHLRGDQSDDVHTDVDTVTECSPDWWTYTEQKNVIDV